MNVMRCLVALFALALAMTVSHAAEVEKKTYTVDRVKGMMIYTTDDLLLGADANTQVVKKTATGEIAAKLADIKQGDKIEVYAEKGMERIKKIILP